MFPTVAASEHDATSKALDLYRSYRTFYSMIEAQESEDDPALSPFPFCPAIATTSPPHHRCLINT